MTTPTNKQAGNITHTRAMAEEVIAALRNAGVQTKLVGSVATKGQSEKDIDLLYEGEGMDDESNNAYMQAMQSLGFEWYGTDSDSEWGYLETWVKPLQGKFDENGDVRDEQDNLIEGPQLVTVDVFFGGDMEPLKYGAKKDEYLYHVTPEKNWKAIQQEGLKQEKGYALFEDQPRATHFTEASGLPFWTKEVTDYYGGPVAILKVPKSKLRGLKVDEFGSEDAGAKAYRYEKDVPPTDISFVKTAAQQPAAPVYFYIEVPRWARSHFWEEPPEGHLEFWAFKDRPRCFYNQKIIFKFDGQPVAEAKVLKIEEPGSSKCEQTGKYEKHWKVFWNPKDFKKYKTASDPLASITKKWKKPDKKLEAFQQAARNVITGTKENAIEYATYAHAILKEFRQDVAPFIEARGLFPQMEDEFAKIYLERLDESLYNIKRDTANLKRSDRNEWDTQDSIEREIEKALKAKAIILQAFDIKKQAAPRSIWYHGTSRKNLQSILKQGLIPDPKEKVWKDDPEASSASPSRESYGGIYVTRNLVTAISSVKDKKTTGGMLIVCAEMQPNTMYMDEDSVKFYLTHAIGHLSENTFHVLCYYLAASHERVSDEWKQEVKQSQQTFIKQVIKQIKYRFEEEQKRPMHADLEKRLEGMLPEVWYASLERLAAHEAAHARDYDLMRAYTTVFSEGGYDYEQIKSQIREFFPSVEQGEKHFREVVDPLTRTLGQMVSGERLNPTARVMEPVGFSGSNRIVGVLDIAYPQGTSSTEADPYRIQVRYGSIPQDFLSQWKERMGGVYVVEKAATAALGDPDDREMPNPLQITPGRPDVIEDWKYLPEAERQQMIKDAEIREIDPRDLKSNQETIDRKGFDHFAQNPQEINKATGGLSGEHQKHPLVLDTREGLYLYDGNHRCAAALKLGITVKCLYIDLRGMEELKGKQGKKKTGAYTAYVLTDAARKVMLEKFPPKFPDVIAHHVTLQFGVPKDAAVPEPAQVKVVGYASDDSLEAAVVSVNGETQRPDGSTYHVTLSLDRSKGRKPVDSNKVVQTGWEPVEPFDIQTMPQKLATDNKLTVKQANVFEHGHCWEWALAYQEINGGDLYVVTGYYDDDGEEVPEYAHAFISKDGGRVGRDARGSRPVRQIIEECHFDHPVKRVVAEPMAKEDFEQFFPDPAVIEQAKKEIPKTADRFDAEGFWVGEGGGASGVLPVCPSKGTVCLAWRSGDVHMGNCWGTLGGAIQKGMTAAESAKAELAEETGYTGSIVLTPAYVFSSGGGFQYHNFIGVVPTEFGFSPAGGHSWETDHIAWVPYHEVLKDMQQNPADYHPGLIKLFGHSRGLIENSLKMQKMGAGTDPKLLAYMNDLWSQTEGHPMLPKRQRLWKERVVIEASPFQGRIHLSYIHSIDPKKGYGTEAMKFLTDLADKHEVAMELEADRPHGMEGPGQPKLISWYKKFGFRQVHRGQVDNNFMVREPKKSLKLGPDMKTIPMDNGGKTSAKNVSNIVKRLAKYCCGEWQCKLEDINRGVCDEFAELLQAQLPGSTMVELSLENDSEWPTHFWVKYNGKHYDATCPEGVKDWKQLPIFRKAVQKGYPPPPDDELLEFNDQGGVIEDSPKTGMSKKEAAGLKPMPSKVAAFFGKTASTVTLNDLYEDGELDDEDEGVGNYVRQFGNMKQDEIRNRPHTVKTLSPEQVKQLKVNDSQTVLEVFQDYAEPWQKQLIKRKMKKFDPNRIIVLDGGYVLDGNHHVVAAIQLNQPVKYIDLEEPESEPKQATEAPKTRWEQMLESEKDKWLGPAWEQSRNEPWVEYVPISELLPLREYHWTQDYNRHGGDEYRDMVEDMKRHGVREPITIRYFKDTNRAKIIEGNHRVSAAQAAGLKEVPARVTIASYPQNEYGKNSYADNQEGGPVRGLLNPDERIYSDYVKPSDIGLTGHKQTKTASEDLDAQYYMEEGCGMFAVALARLTEGRVYVISNPEGEKWNDDIDYELSHAFVHTSSGDYDIRGKRAPKQMAQELHITDYDILGPWSAQEFMNRFMGMGDKPLYGEEPDIQEVTQYIKQHANRYDLPKTASSGMTRVPIDNLPEDTKRDLVYMLSSELGIEEDEIYPNLFGLVDPPTVLVGHMPTEQLYATSDRKPSEVAVQKYKDMLSDDFEFDPILVANGKFYDGGHRLEAYHRAGRPTIPVVDVSNLVNASPETWQLWIEGEGTAENSFPITAAKIDEPSGLQYGKKRMKFVNERDFVCECGNSFDNDMGYWPSDKPGFRLVDRSGRFISNHPFELSDNDDSSNAFLQCMGCDTMYERFSHDGKNLWQVIPTDQKLLFSSMKEARPTDAKINLLKTQLKLDDQQVEQVIAADPTEKDYVTWIAKWMQKGNIRLPEDTEKIKNQLTTFNKLKRSPNFQGNRDIGTYTPATLFQTLESNSKDVSKKEQKREDVRTGAELVVSQGEYQIYRVAQKEIVWPDNPALKGYRADESAPVKALVELSGGTNWCTAQEHYAKQYLADGPSYVMFLKNSAYAQLHPATDSFMDRTDEPLSRDIMWKDEKNPNVMKRRGLIIDETAQQFLNLLIPVAADVAKWYKTYDPKNIPVDKLVSATDKLSVALATNTRLPQEVEDSLWGQAGQDAGSFEGYSRYGHQLPWELVNRYIAAFIKQRVPAWEQQLLGEKSYMSAINDYCERIIGGRWPEFEARMDEKSWIGSTPLSQLVRYCENSMKGRWRTVEAFINQMLKLGTGHQHTDAREAAVDYATYVLKAPFSSMFLNPRIGDTPFKKTPGHGGTWLDAMKAYIRGLKKNGLDWPEGEAEITRLSGQG